MVPMAGLEPAWFAPLDFESSAYTNFATSADMLPYEYKLISSERQAKNIILIFFLQCAF